MYRPISNFRTYYCLHLTLSEVLQWEYKKNWKLKPIRKLSEQQLKNDELAAGKV
jgi:hypothetical protein